MSAQQALRDGIPITEEALDMPLVDVLVSRVPRVNCSFPSYLTHKSSVKAVMRALTTVVVQEARPSGLAHVV